MVETYYATDGTLGVELDQTNTDPQFSLGKVIQGADNSEWLYVQANGAIEQYGFVVVSEAFQATAPVLATGDLGDRGAVAVATAFADDDYGWVCRKGAGSDYKVLVDASCNANAVLHTSSVSGGLSDATVAGSNAVEGIFLTAAGDTVAGGEDCVIEYPSIGADN